jgi:hypothetical protein
MKTINSTFWDGVVDGVLHTALPNPTVYPSDAWMVRAAAMAKRKISFEFGTDNRTYMGTAFRLFCIVLALTHPT